MWFSGAFFFTLLWGNSVTVGKSKWGFRVFFVFGFVLGFLTHRTCGDIKMLGEYLTFYKVNFWRSVRNRSKQEHKKNMC